MSSVHLDSTSLVLGGVVGALLLAAIAIRPPPPQAHPFLLGRQSNVERTRLANESPVYTNSSSSGLRPPLRPEKKIKSLLDILQASTSLAEGGARGTWIHGGETLVEVVLQLRAGLLATLGSGAGTVAVLVDDPTDALLLTLALALTPHTPLVVAPGSSLPSDVPVSAIFQSSTRFSPAQALSSSPNAKFISLGAAGAKSAEAEDLLATGKAILADAKPVAEAQPADLALTIISEGIPLAITHVNLTASLIAWLSLFPAAPRATRPTSSDVIVSFHHPSTPYGLGLALLALYTSSALSLPALSATPDSDALTLALRSPSALSPTMIFGPAPLISQPFSKLLLGNMLGDSAFMVRHARDGKLRLLREGTVSQSTWWDKLIFTSLRKEVGLPTIRAVVLEGPVDQNRVEFFRIVLGAPVVVTLAHAFLLAPLSAGNLYDYQRLPPPGVIKENDLSTTAKAHVGPPVGGVEVKLRGEEKDMVAGRVRGEVLVRSPVLPRADSLPPSLLLKDADLPQLPPYPGRAAESEEGSGARWLRTGVQAEMGKEGVLWPVV
ncbi:hypothetical protein RQP46_000801 [Phenoliferia psychrophenolica]